MIMDNSTKVPSFKADSHLVDFHLIDLLPQESKQGRIAGSFAYQIRNKANPAFMKIWSFT